MSKMHPSTSRCQMHPRMSKCTLGLPNEHLDICVFGCPRLHLGIQGWIWTGSIWTPQGAFGHAGVHLDVPGSIWTSLGTCTNRNANANARGVHLDAQNAPQLVQMLLRTSKCTPACPNAPWGFQMLPGTSKSNCTLGCPNMYPGASKCSSGRPNAPSDAQMYPEASKCIP